MGNCEGNLLEVTDGLDDHKEISSCQTSAPPVAAHSSPQVLGRVSCLLLVQPSPQAVQD